MPPEDISFEVIENIGKDNNLRDVLKTCFAKASEAYIAVAFVTESGLNEIIQPLGEVAVRGKVRLITGLYQHVTEPKALKTLLSMQNEPRTNLSVKLSKEPQFHRKIYLMENKRQAIAIIGSSNLTREGMRSGGELDLMLSLSPNSPYYVRLKEALEKDWNQHRSVRLNREQIKRYENARPTKPQPRGYTKGQLKKILGKHIAAPPDDEKIRIWRDCITGIVKQSTVDAIARETSWEKRKYDWFVRTTNFHYRIGDRIFLFDFPAKRLSLVEVIDTTRMPINTPDGRYFVAHKQVRTYSRRFSKTLWEQLKDEKIGKGNAKEHKEMKGAASQRLKSLLRNPRRSQQA